LLSWGKDRMSPSIESTDIVPHPEDHRVLVCLHSLTNPRSNAALAALCETLNALEVRYPGTDLQLVTRCPALHTFLRPCQES
jgi:hypothetical protein